MIKKTQILQIITLVFTLSILGFSQKKNNLEDPYSIQEKDIELKLILEKNQFRANENIDLVLLIRNNFSADIDVPYSLGDPFGGYLIEIKNSKGDLVKLVKAPSFGREEHLRILSGGSRKTPTLPISRFYKLPVGRYSVALSIRVINRLKRQVINIKSKPKTLKIVA